jgi:hypothetical protein
MRGGPRRRTGQAAAAVGHSYDSSASKLIEAMATTRNGLCGLGIGVRMSAHNYSLAEAMSNIGGNGSPLPSPPSPGPISAGSPPSSVGGSDAAPRGWGWSHLAVVRANLCPPPQPQRRPRPQRHSPTAGHPRVANRAGMPPNRMTELRPPAMATDRRISRATATDTHQPTARLTTLTTAATIQSQSAP